MQGLRWLHLKDPAFAMPSKQLSGTAVGLTKSIFDHIGRLLCDNHGKDYHTINEARRPAVEELSSGKPAGWNNVVRR